MTRFLLKDRSCQVSARSCCCQLPVSACPLCLPVTCHCLPRHYYDEYMNMNMIYTHYPKKQNKQMMIYGGRRPLNGTPSSCLSPNVWYFFIIFLLCFLPKMSYHSTKRTKQYVTRHAFSFSMYGDDIWMQCAPSQANWAESLVSFLGDGWQSGGEQDSYLALMITYY